MREWQRVSETVRRGGMGQGAVSSETATAAEPVQKM